MRPEIDYLVFTCQGRVARHSLGFHLGVVGRGVAKLVVGATRDGLSGVHLSNIQERVARHSLRFHLEVVGRGSS